MCILEYDYIICIELTTMRLSIHCGMLQCINYIMHIALNVDFLQWLPHYNNIIGAVRLLQVQSLNVSSYEKRDHLGFVFVVCSL